MFAWIKFSITANLPSHYIVHAYFYYQKEWWYVYFFLYLYNYFSLRNHSNAFWEGFLCEIDSFDFFFLFFNFRTTVYFLFFFGTVGLKRGCIILLLFFLKGSCSISYRRGPTAVVDCAGAVSTSSLIIMQPELI